MNKKIQLSFKKLKKDKFLIFDNNESVKIKLNNCFIKFGIESYNSNKILNFTVNKNTSPEQYNNLTYIQNILNIINNLKEDVVDKSKYNINNKNFISPLKKTELTDINNLSFRTYLNHNINITNQSSPLSSCSDIKNNFADITITLKNMWNTNDNFGVTVFTDIIQVTDKNP